MDQGEDDRFPNEAVHGNVKLRKGSRLSDSRRFSKAARVLGVFVLCLIFSSPVVALQVRDHPGVFRVDEHMYIDYLFRVDAGHYLLPHGQLLTTAAINEIRCRGTEPIPPPATPPKRNCQVSPYGKVELPDGGYNSADIYPPTYFVVTDLGARLLMDMGVTSNLVTAGRLTGALWMAFGMTIVFLLARELGAKVSAALAALALTGCTPWFLAFWFHLTPDAMSLPMGGLVALTALKWDRKQLRIGWLLAASVVSIAIKPVNILGISGVGLYFAIRAVRRLSGLTVEESTGAGQLPVGRIATPSRWTTIRHEVIGIASTVGIGLASLLAWLLIRAVVNGQGRSTPYDHLSPVHGFDWAWLSRYFAAFIRIQNLGWSDVYAISVLFPVLVIGAAVTVAFAQGDGSRLHAFALSTVSLTLIGPFLLVVFTALTTGNGGPPEVRYGLSLMAPCLAIAATAWRTRFAQLVIWVLILLLALTSLNWANL